MLEINDQPPKMSDLEKTQLIQWTDSTFANQPRGQLSVIFNSKYRITTLTLSVSWFLINYIYYGQLIVLPFVFGS